jgi:hypothetical protein
MNRTWALSLVCFSTVAALTGCTIYEQPGIEVTSVRLAEVSDEAAALEFALDMHNPNNEPLTLLEFDYQLSIDGRHVYDGRRAAETVLATRGRKQVSIPAVVRFEQIAGEGSLFVARGSLNEQSSTNDEPRAMNHEAPALPVRYTLHAKLRYITPGKIAEVLYDLYVSRPNVKFSDEGEVALRPD